MTTCIECGHLPHLETCSCFVAPVVSTDADDSPVPRALPVEEPCVIVRNDRTKIMEALAELSNRGL